MPPEIADGTWKIRGSVVGFDEFGQEKYTAEMVGPDGTPVAYVPELEEPRRTRSKPTPSRPCLSPSRPSVEADAEPVAVEADTRHAVPAVNDRDGDSDGDGSNDPTTPGFLGRYSTLADDGLPPSHLGALIRRYRMETLVPSIAVPLRMPTRGATLRSLAEWMKVCFELRLEVGLTEAMGFSLSLACVLLGWDPDDDGDRSNASNAIHRLEKLGVIDYAYSVPVPRRGKDGTEMRCFLPVGIDLEALLTGELEEAA
jgi:hypothetical protein